MKAGISAACCFFLSGIVSADNIYDWVPSISLTDELGEPELAGFCLDVSGFGAGINCNQLQTHSCKRQGADTQFEYDPSKNAIKATNYAADCSSSSSDSDKACVVVTSAIQEGATLGLAACDGSAAQTFELVDGQFRIADGMLCLGGSSELRAAGSFWARSLSLFDCASTDPIYTTWTVLYDPSTIIKPTEVPVGEIPLPVEIPESNSDPAAPTDAPVAVIDIPPGTACFSGETQVHVQGKGPVFMKDLQLGSMIMTTASNQTHYEPVYAFGHRDYEIKATFLRLMPSALELSPDHMVYIVGKGFIPSSMVRVGDQTENGDVVTGIETIARRGVYAPFTPSGSLLVNGVLGSSYVALQMDSAVLKLGNSTTFLTHQWLSHAFLAPHRFWFHWLGHRCDNGSKFAPWTSSFLDFSRWLLRQNWIFAGAILVPVVAGASLLVAVEWLLLMMHPALLLFSFTAGAIFVVNAFHKQRIVKHADKIARRN